MTFTENPKWHFMKGWYQEMLVIWKPNMLEFLPCSLNWLHFEFTFGIVHFVSLGRCVHHYVIIQWSFIALKWHFSNCENFLKPCKILNPKQKSLHIKKYFSAYLCTFLHMYHKVKGEMMSTDSVFSPSIRGCFFSYQEELGQQPSRKTGKWQEQFVEKCK